MPVLGEYSGSLSNGGEKLELIDNVGGVIHDFSYDSNGDWPDRADGLGASLEIIDGDGNYNNPSNWRDSSEYLGTPATTGSGYGGNIVINEVLSHTDPPQTDSIELFNMTDRPISIGGWYLSDSASNYLKYEIPEDAVVPANGYLVFDESDFNISMGEDDDDFALNSWRGEQVVLTQVVDGDVLRWVDQVEFGAQANGESWARTPNGTGILYPAVETTLGAENAGPRIGPVVVSEIMYHPVPPSAEVSPEDLEFVEIHNTGDVLTEMENWRVRGGIDFDFSAGTTMGPGGFLVLVSFDPADEMNAAKLETFRSYYGIDANVPLVGPFAGPPGQRWGKGTLAATRHATAGGTRIHSTADGR